MVRLGRLYISWERATPGWFWEIRGPNGRGVYLGHLRIFLLSPFAERRRKTSRPNNGGWDFVKVGGIYQYKEEIGPFSALIAMVEIVEDNSDQEYYNFKVKPLRGNEALGKVGPEPFVVSHLKDPGGYYSGMPQFYKEPEYAMLPPSMLWPVDFTEGGK